jgi:hypothetical protein
MDGDEFSVAIGSQGWEIRLDQAPSSKPQVMHLGGRVESVAALDPAFIERANQLLTIRARRMYTGVACQRPRRSTMPDQKSRALHSISRGLSAEWHCLHCDGAHDGKKFLALPVLRSDTNRHLPRTILEWDQTVRLTASCALTGPAEIAGQTFAPATFAEGQSVTLSGSNEGLLIPAMQKYGEGQPRARSGHSGTP